jgi:hypothetical protein
MQPDTAKHLTALRQLTISDTSPNCNLGMDETEIANRAVTNALSIYRCASPHKGYMLTAIERIVNDWAWFAVRRRLQSGTKDGCGHAFRDESWRTFGSNEFSESIESNAH